MQKDLKSSQETNNINNINNPDPTKENQSEAKAEILNNNLKQISTKENEIKDKKILTKSELLNKPKELLEFDVLSHFNENISRPDKNDLNNISQNSYYCINCKHSDCPFYDEKKHLIINRVKCLLYDSNFFDEIDSYINEALNFSYLKNEIKDNINNYVDKMKETLDKLRENKFNEIDVFFEENQKNFYKLKNEYINIRKNIEEYYEINKKFFNIELNQEKIDENKNIPSILNNNEKDEKENCYIEDIDISSPNRDIENAVFLLNFELMNLCETKNLENIYYIKTIKKRIELFNTKIQSELDKDVNTIFKFINLETKPEKYIENKYWDVEIRTKKYTEIINQFKETICDIYHRTGNLEKIKDLIDILDSKLKKNNKIIFGQKYFNKDKKTIEVNNLNLNNKENISNNEQRNTVNSRKRNNISATHKRTSSKAKSLKKYNTVRGKSSNKNKRNDNNIKNNIQTLTLSNDILLRNIIKNKNEKYNQTETNINNTNNAQVNQKKLYQKMINFQNCIPDDIILDKRVIQRFFAYSISEIYKKNFEKIDVNNTDIYYNIINKDNIYLNKERQSKNQKDMNNKNINNNNNKRGTSSKKYKFNNTNNTNNRLMPNYYTNRTKPNNRYEPNNNLEKEKFDIEKMDPSNQYNIKSVSYLSNYTNRYNSLKEIAKPIIGSNQIQLFFQKSQKIIRKTTSLNKEEHGYSLFPEGCRHILIENNLYIIGGTNHVRQPINIVLCYNILFGTLKRLQDMVFPHSYHTVEYLENFDSIICIGGENSNQCEIMDLENKKWIKLPNLNNPRGNANIYYNNLTSELFVLFGICGIMCEKINYSDSIEVLELKDIDKGWIIVDYYKTPGLNLKLNYCMTIPFTKEQLLIYGGSNMRSFSKNIYALFHMIKNECNKVDTQTMELIKLEEKKSRLVDLALTKLS
jgi:hypothetical protein